MKLWNITPVFHNVFVLMNEIVKSESDSYTLIATAYLTESIDWRQESINVRKPIRYSGTFWAFLELRQSPIRTFRIFLKFPEK